MDGDAIIEITDIASNNRDGVVWEWEGSIRGNEITLRYELKRQIHKVPPLILKSEKGVRNREFYEPLVVSLGPYHHKRHDLAVAEKYKFITLQEYRLSSGKTMELLYEKVFEVIHDARKCYIDGSTDDYNDDEFTQMMLRDGCFVLFFIECVSHAKKNVLLHNEYLGALGFAKVARDTLLLENQIPFVVLEVLLGLRFPDKGEEILNGFFNYLNYGEVSIRVEKVLELKQPLHLLELYRSYFISLSASFGLGSTKPDIWRRWANKFRTNEKSNYVKRNRWIASVMELKSKGIFLKCSYDESSNEDIKFHSYCCYGELELVRRVVSSSTKAIYLNMIAYEMSPHNRNDFRVSTYIKVMKSLITNPDDVKELRKTDVMIHLLQGDEDVVKMFGDIEVPAINLNMFNRLQRAIEKHYYNKYKTGAAEVLHVYFSSPWKAVASLAATSILFVSFVQTYFTVKPFMS